MPRFFPPLPIPQVLEGPTAAAYLRRLHTEALAGDVPTLDTEGTPIEDGDGISGRRFLPVLLSVTHPERMDRVCIPLDTPEALGAAEALMGDPQVVSAWHNGGFDWLALQNLGIQLNNKILDTMLLDWMFDAEGRTNRHGIDPIAIDEFDIDCPKFPDVFANPDVLPPGLHKPTSNISDYPLSVTADYATTDTYRGALVMKLRRNQLENTPLDGAEDLGPLQTVMDKYWLVEEPHLRTLLGMEQRGTHIDTGFLRELSRRMSEAETEAQTALFQALGRTVAVNSPQQLGQLLFNELGFVPSTRTKSGAWSVDADVLKDCAYQAQMLVQQGRISADDARFVIVKSIVTAKDIAKHRGTFVDGILAKLDSQNFIHTHYNVLIRTNRLSSQDPNLQNLPNPEFDDWETRRAWDAAEEDGEETCLVIADWSQIEMVLLAAFTQDPAMLDDVVNGRDFHSSAAARGLGMSYADFLVAKKADAIVDPRNGLTAGQLRQGFKTVRFADVYGAEGAGLAKQMSDAMKRAVGIPEAEEFQRRLNALNPVAAAWKESTKAYARKMGYVQTILGHRRRVVGIDSPREGDRKRAERVAINTIIQGSAADMMKIALLTVDRDPELRAMGFKLRLQVHDEIVGSVKRRYAEAAIARVRDTMEHPFKTLGLGFPLPLRCSIAGVQTWFEGK